MTAPRHESPDEAEPHRAAVELSVSNRQVYNLLARYRADRRVSSLLPLRNGARKKRLCRGATATHRRRSTWLQFCALCLAGDRAPYFRRCWRLASRVSCFRHGCGLRDRCPACRGGLAPFAQADLAPQHLCAHCDFDLRGAARVSVTAAARRLERSIDDFIQALIAKRSPAIPAWVERLARLPELAEFESGRSLVELSAAARLRCFERLAQGADEGAAAGFAGPRELPEAVTGWWAVSWNSSTHSSHRNRSRRAPRFPCEALRRRQGSGGLNGRAVSATTPTPHRTPHAR